MACCKTSIRFSKSTGGSDPSSDVLPDTQACKIEAKAQFASLSSGASKRSNRLNRQKLRGDAPAIFATSVEAPRLSDVPIFIETLILDFL